MVIDNKYFVGGLNSDDEDRVIPNGDYRYALNIRNSKSDSDSQGSIENVKGNTLTQVYLGTGTFKTIGAYDDVLNNKVYYFVWNDNLTHSIFEYAADTNTIVLVLSGAALNFQKDKLIIEQNIAVIDGLLYWTDGYNPPRKINIQRAKSGLISGFDDVAISAIKPSPIYAPISTFETDTTIKQNSVRGKLFQFRYKWVYEDNEESAWSPISKVALPINEGQYRPASFYPTELNNNIKVEIDLGTSEVKRVKIAFRESNIGDFYLYKDIDKSLNTVTPTSYNFFNDEVYTALNNDGNTGMRLFDWLPLKANTQALIDGNKIAYGGITDGYDPVPIDIDINKVTGVLPRTSPPDSANLITNQYAPTGMYGVSLNNNSNASAFQSFFTEGGSTWAIAGNTQYVKWYKQNIPNYSNIPSFTHSDILNISRNAGTRGWYDGDTDAIWITSVHSLEVLLKNDLNGSISAGARIVIKIKVEWYNFQNLIPNTQIFTFQEVAIAGDSATSILQRFKAQINNKTYTDANVEITFGSEVGSYSRGYGYDINIIQGVNYGSILGVQVRASIPSANVVPTTAGVGCLINTQTISIETYSAWTTLSKKTLKMGAKHGIGIVYKDYAGRSGLTNTLTDKSFYVEYPTEKNIGSSLITDTVSLSIGINHKAPLWANTYQFVYTGNKTIEKLDTTEGYKGFVQTKLSSVTSASGLNDALQASFSGLRLYRETTSENINIAYTFTKGDRIRFLKDTNDNYYQTYIDVEIISFDSATETIIFKKPNITITGSPIVEVYTPKKTAANEYYYEIGEEYRCVNGLHYGDVNQQEDINGLITIPATVTLDDIGDVYLRYRTSPITTQIEDYNYSDFYDSDSWDKGRPNISDNNIKQTYRPSTIRYSESYIPETNINGLSTFNDFYFEAYDQKYGAIKLMYSEDKLLNIFQQLKVGAIGISQDVIYGDAGEVVSTSRNENRVLSKSMRYYAGEFGIGNNPESFTVYGNSKYFTDAKRGVVCRLGGDGITPISEYKMHNYFTDIFEELDTNSSILPYNIFAVYDVRFDELVLHITNGVINETLSFSETKNRWVSFHSYSPDFMVSNRIGLISFFKGELYKHNSNSLYNNFYGNQSTSQVKFISNIEPNKIKVFTNITEDSTDVWSMSEATNQYGQKTSLIDTDFEDVEGVYKATLLRDENTPNEQYPLIEGDVMRSHSLVITLDNESTDFQKLFSVGVGVTLSELTNR